MVLASSSCRAEKDTCRIVLVESEGYDADRQVSDAYAGETLTFMLYPEQGYSIKGCDYTDYTLQQLADGMLLTLYHVKYNERVHLDVKKTDKVFYCYGQGGRFENGSDRAEYPVVNSHLRLNTPLGRNLHREAHTLIGWNTQEDGKGNTIGLGSRTDLNDGNSLYAQWAPWTDVNQFTWEERTDGIHITGYTGHEERIVIPGLIGNQPVRFIEKNAFKGVKADGVVFPDSLVSVEDGAFEQAEFSELWLFDSLRNFSDYGFLHVPIRTLHILAFEAPVYSGTYYATFPDKMDRLIMLKQKKKIVFFSGSSARFGYDCERIDRAFPDYDVINMGVFAYTNALPQFEIIRTCMQSGDILVHSPEFDAAQRQFCTSSNLDAAFYKMIEEDYDILTRLDLSGYTQVFTALHEYLLSRKGMEQRSYELSPSSFDEDGNPSSAPSYNIYGDYVLYRENAETEKPVYGLQVRYVPAAYPEKNFIEPLNRAYRSFLEKGIRVYFTYAPRNRIAVSEDSTQEARQLLDAHFRKYLCVPVISELEDSLVSGRYLYGTDNHLSTEGVQIRTSEIIKDLKMQMEMEKDENA